MTQPEMIKKVATVVAKMQEGVDKEKVHIITKVEIEDVIKAYTDVILDGLADGEEIPVPKVGKFQVKDAAEREAFINPRQKELGKKKVPAHKVPKFSFGKASKEATK